MNSIVFCLLVFVSKVIEILVAIARLKISKIVIAELVAENIHKLWNRCCLSSDFLNIFISFFVSFFANFAKSCDSRDVLSDDLLIDFFFDLSINLLETFFLTRLIRCSMSRSTNSKLEKCRFVNLIAFFSILIIVFFLFCDSFDLSLTFIFADSLIFSKLLNSSFLNDEKIERDFMRLLESLISISKNDEVKRNFMRLLEFMKNSCASSRSFVDLILNCLLRKSFSKVKLFVNASIENSIFLNR